MPKFPNHITKELVADLYINQGMSVSSVGKHLNKSPRSVSRYLKKYHILARPFSTKGLRVSLGMKRSVETRQKIREAKLGTKIPIEVRRKMGRKGMDNAAYIDGRTPLVKLIRHSIEYKLWREAVFKRDNWTCLWCFQRGGVLNADHIKPFAHFPELRFAIDNGRTLCLPCHRTTDTYGNKKQIN